MTVQDVPFRLLSRVFVRLSYLRIDETRVRGADVWLKGSRYNASHTDQGEMFRDSR